MPPRRSHKKSKAGCQRCKLRKIKCDEVRPRCGNCVKHGVSCDFENPGCVKPPPPPTPPSHQRRESTTTATPSSPSSTSSPVTRTMLVPMYQQPSELIRLSSNAKTSRALELRLMHHYTSMTANTFGNTVEQNRSWQIAVPSLAYDAEYLMDAILAVSALHLRSLHPEDKSLVRASHGYMASALAQYSILLQNGVTEENAEALFSTSALIAFNSSAGRRFELEHTDEYALPLAWFHSFQGVKAMVMASWQWLRNSDRVFPIINAQPALALVHPDPNSFFAPILEGLDEQIENLPPPARAETKQAFEHAVAFLNWAHKKPERNRILGFAATVSKRFIELVELCDPRALATAACFFAMTKVVDDNWWLINLAKLEVNGIFSLMPVEWYPRMAWPMRVANHEGEMDSDTWGFNFMGHDVGFVEEELEVRDLKAHIDLLAELLKGETPLCSVD